VFAWDVTSPKLVEMPGELVLIPPKSVIVTSALGTTAPEESWTEPTTDPPFVCPIRNELLNRASPIMHRTNLRFTSL
jgi:hypothetical protein